MLLLRLDLDTPGAASSPDSRAKRSNPLVDLIETEKLYVDQLTGVIRVGCSSYCLPAPYLISLLIVHTESRGGMVAL